MVSRLVCQHSSTKGFLYSSIIYVSTQFQFCVHFIRLWAKISLVKKVYRCECLLKRLLDQTRQGRRNQLDGIQIAEAPGVLSSDPRGQALQGKARFIGLVCPQDPLQREQSHFYLFYTLVLPTRLPLKNNTPVSFF